jgi:hypothetical protein
VSTYHLGLQQIRSTRDREQVPIQQVIYDSRRFVDRLVILWPCEDSLASSYCAKLGIQHYETSALKDTCKTSATEDKSTTKDSTEELKLLAGANLLKLQCNEPNVVEEVWSQTKTVDADDALPTIPTMQCADLFGEIIKLIYAPPPVLPDHSSGSSFLYPLKSLTFKNKAKTLPNSLNGRQSIGRKMGQTLLHFFPNKVSK